VDFSSLELSPDETSRQRVLDAINDNTVLCGTEWWGSVLNPSRRLVFVAKDEAAARVIAGALKRRASEASREAVAVKAKRKEQSAFDEARHAAGARAARSAKLDLKGRRLSVTVAVEPNAAELRAMSSLLDARRATAKRAAEVVRNLAEGKLPSAEELGTFLAPQPSKAETPP
jgi:hypothetical protein